ncbi:TMF-regulated nuclear protein 1 [Liparis tanakae]|uniref:TMF-regulated nuclear protein 1 n=1 Tax=Liparis tanakae TaxID=230148 RepID=A0A4Z2FSJ6_9TELE|nr:TMF-regulated nuclear protein 1 [Liparis tanakae]
MNGALSGRTTARLSPSARLYALAREDEEDEEDDGERERRERGEREVTMKRRQRHTDLQDEDKAASVGNKDPHPDILPPDLPSPSSSSSSPPLPPSAMPPSTSASALLAPASPATRRSISMGDFRRVTGALLAGSGPPSAAATAPSSRLVTPSSSMEFQAARRRLLEVEERQRVIREMERRLEELREVFVRSEEEAVVHGEVAARISSAAQQGELCVGENSQRLKKGLRFKKHRPAIVFSSMLGLRTCLPWPVKLK